MNKTWNVAWRNMAIVGHEDDGAWVIDYVDGAPYGFGVGQVSFDDDLLTELDNFVDIFGFDND